MSHVFISYKHEDIDFEITLADEIRKAGFDVWIDKSSGKLPAGTNWREEIDQAIKDGTA